MINVETLRRLNSNETSKTVLYRNDRVPKKGVWTGLFCYKIHLPPKTMLQTHAHTDMQEGFRSIEGDLIIITKTPEETSDQVLLHEGACIIVRENVWHTLINPSDHDITFLAFGITRDIQGKTLNK